MTIETPIIHNGDKTKVWRALIENVNILRADHAQLIMDYRRRHIPDPHKPDQIEFEFIQNNPDKSNPKRHAHFAQMHLQIIDDQTFNLHHRHVSPEFRDSNLIAAGKEPLNLSTRLYRQAESWIQQIANIKQQDQSIKLNVGQKSVIKWALNNGFTFVDDESMKQYQYIIDNPDLYVEDYAHVSDESLAQGIVRDKYLFSVDYTEDEKHIEKAIRFNLIKVIHPTVDDTRK